MAGLAWRLFKQGCLVALPLLSVGLMGTVFHLRTAMRIGLDRLAVGACAVLLWTFVQRYLTSWRQPLETHG